jgi:HSP20 family protein
MFPLPIGDEMPCGSHPRQRSYGTFLRSLRLPYSVDTDKIRADFANGVLTVTQPQYKGKENTVG